MSVADAPEPPGTGALSGETDARDSSAVASPQATNEAKQETIVSGPDNVDTVNLLPKFLKTTRILLASKSFFFSYEYDITRRLGCQGSQTAKGSELPLHRAVDPLVCRLTSLSPHHLALVTKP